MALKKPRIGVFGGAFDPPHNAHVAMAQAALAQLDLTQLCIFPTGQAWHKDRALSPAQHRLAMSHLAFDDLPDTRVDPREILRAGPTYTLDTLRELQHEQPGAQFVLILGADQASSLHTWHGFEEILSIAIISVAYRALSTGSDGQFDPSSLPSVPPGARFEKLQLPPMDISATDIRARAQRGEDLRQLVPPAVARYIEQHHLYRSA
ncbi:nicotinate-nucleotide adenylyltransferase [Variovorax sp. HW608]|uniref:nicotinate (nicotinamide) nucleotide adenylyltransferase n=1 Tax=Variovorax sp. HW608 TaxID=1034889 RepID=UPI00081FBE36|nr:nicotinate (nicotinamide) nucleotide adenylyltransferase [Variovorax sp. HW608]SCK54265.1 nicotinate-nucleotide adenylyltransferase [Variovorax sp. HW608]